MPLTPQFFAVGLFSLIGGFIGAWVMNQFLLWTNKMHPSVVDMSEIAGRFFKRNSDDARMRGRAIHLACGAGLGLVVGYILWVSGATELPGSIFLGMAVGLFLGMFGVFALMYLIFEKHPSGNKNEVTMQAGVLYLVGHVIFGAITGLAAGFVGFV